MDEIESLLNELEGEILKAKKAAFSNTDVVVNKTAILSIITRIRGSYPLEMRNAAQVLKDKDDMLQQAQDYANKTMDLATEKARKMIDESEVVNQARAEAQKIFNESVEKCNRMEYDARYHVYLLFEDAENRLKQLLQTAGESKENVKRGTPIQGNA